MHAAVTLTHDDLDDVYYELAHAFGRVHGDTELFTHRLILLLVEAVGDRDRCIELVRQAVPAQTIDELKKPGEGMAGFAENRNVHINLVD